MAIQNIKSQSLKPSFEAKRYSVDDLKENQHKKHSVVKTLAWSTAAVAAAAALTIAGVKLAKSGKFNKVKQQLKNLVHKPQQKYISRGTKTQSFESPKAMADEIVANFDAMKKRIKAHNLIQHKYNNMDWSAAVQPRANIVK